MGIDAAIVDYSVGLLLRYFRAGAPVKGEVSRLDQRRDAEILKGHWSLAEPVRSLVTYLLDHPHEAQAFLTYQKRVDNALARGRIDARKTWVYRQQTGLSSALVTHEPVRSFNTGPNMLLAWVLREAAIYTARLLTWQAANSAYLRAIEAAQADMRKAQRIEGLREPLRAVSLGHRPSGGAVRDSARSRRAVYRLAVQAYCVLQGLERGDRDAIEAVARSALVGPLEDWRRFELAVGLAVGEALGRAINAPLQLHLLGSKSSGPIVTAGRFAIYWQQITPHYTPPPLEPSEIAARAALRDYGIAIGTERPDLIVVDCNKGAVVSVVEVKYIAGDTASARFREAVDQVVRYVRSYVQQGMHPDVLLARSLVAMSRDAPARLHNCAAAPFAVDFDLLCKPDGLDPWAQAVIV
jgi:hypothetical protein